MSKAPSSLFEVYCVGPEDDRGQVDILRDLLINSGVKAQGIAVFDRGGAFRVSVYLTTRPKAESLRRKLNCQLRGKVRFRLRTLKNENWVAKSAKNFTTFTLSRHFDIVPSWKLKTYRKGRRRSIILSAINAFGTGQHETTSFMAHLIEERRGRIQELLDVGTGTGLLAMIALMNGARAVCAIDADRDAVAAAKKNFVVNGLDPRFVKQADIRTYRSQKRFDFVAANLITRDLIAFRDKILAFVAPKGFLAISGILLENYPEIRKAFALKKLRCVKVRKGEQWAAILYQRRK